MTTNDNPITWFANEPTSDGPSTTEMTSQIELITPDIARALLDGNTANRNSVSNHVAFLAKQMREGRWLLTSAPISFAKNGQLLDGQHRLLAVIESNTTQRFWVARGCDPAIFAVLDTGRLRRSADVLSIEGAKNVTALSGLIRLILLHEQGLLSAASQRKRTYANDEILAHYRTNDLLPYLTLGITLYSKSRLLKATEYAFVYHLLAKVDEPQAKCFVEQIASGAGLADKSPGLLLRQKMEAAKQGRVNLSPIERLAICVKAWNAMRQQTPLTMLRVSPGEGFPDPV